MEPVHNVALLIAEANRLTALRELQAKELEKLTQESEQPQAKFDFECQQRENRFKAEFQQKKIFFERSIEELFLRDQADEVEFLRTQEAYQIDISTAGTLP